jgi:cell wall assembly regulator SMI1
MKFTEAEAPLTEDDVSAAEMHAGVLFPRELRRQYLQSNGGSPEPYVYEDDNLDTVVAEYLPLKSSRGTGTAVDAYRNLVLSKKIVPPNFFPFAVDGGGDYFFLDCSSPDGLVYFYRGDTSDDETQRLLALNVGIGEFWSRLKEE